MPSTDKLICPECGAPMVARNSKYGPFYGCTRWPTCTASHGAHPDGRPLGIPADKETKNWRIQAHEAFDKLWKGKRKQSTTRDNAYRWMRKQMHLSEEDAHIGRFTKEQCQELLQLLRERQAKSAGNETGE